MSQKSQVATIITSAGAVIIASMLAIFLMGRAAINANVDLILRHKVIGQLQEILSTIKDAETGQLGRPDNIVQRTIDTCGSVLDLSPNS